MLDIHCVEEEEEQWEKDLDAELQEYEVVNDGSTSGTRTTSKHPVHTNEDWEKDVDDLLDGDDDDIDDLK